MRLTIALLALACAVLYLMIDADYRGQHEKALRLACFDLGLCLAAALAVVEAAWRAVYSESCEEARQRLDAYRAQALDWRSSEAIRQDTRHLTEVFER